MSVRIAVSVTNANVPCSILQPEGASITDFTWIIGGPQGSGVETASTIFSTMCAKAGYHVFGKREFHSNIKGEHSYFVVRVSDRPVRSNISTMNLLVSYDAETIFRHYDSVASDGIIMYDTDLTGVKAADIATLDQSFLDRLNMDVSRLDVPPTVQGILDSVSRSGVRTYPVSFKELLAKLAEDLDNPRLKVMKRIYNVLGVSLSAGLVGLPENLLLGEIQNVFAAKPAISELNTHAGKLAYDAAASMNRPHHILSGIEGHHNMALMQGYQGTAIGKMVAGCRFQSYYPITPASDESVYMESHEILDVENTRPGSMLIVQTEDEISAIGMMIGSALTGVRSSTSTSGPGFSLMAEALGWAGINEVSVVLTLYQRSGPSTGLPTRHGQDDLLFAVFAGHGEFPRIVYASGDIEESFYDTCLCFNYSDVYQMPVIHMMDKLLASTTATCPVLDPSRVTIDRGKLLDGMDGKYKRFQLGDDNISPRSYLGLDDGIFWVTGDESDETGHITEDPVMRRNMMDKRLDRLDMVLEQVPRHEQAISYGIGEYTIISWGSCKGPVLDAIEMLSAKGIQVGFVQVKMLQPFPTEYVRELLKDARVVIDVEANKTGQLAKLFSQNIRRDVDYYILKYTGRAITCDELCDAILNIIRGNAHTMTVLTYGS